MAEKRKLLSDAEKLEIIDRMAGRSDAERLALLDEYIEGSRPAPDDAPPDPPSELRPAPAPDKPD